MKCAYFNCFLLPNYLKFFQIIEAFFGNKKIEASFVVTKVQASHDKFPNPTNPDPLAQDKWNAILLCCSISDLIECMCSKAVLICYRHICQPVVQETESGDSFDRSVGGGGGGGSGHTGLQLPRQGPPHSGRRFWGKK